MIPKKLKSYALQANKLPGGLNLAETIIHIE